MIFKIINPLFIVYLAIHQIILNAGSIFSDNYFDVTAGRTVSVSCPIPEGWSTEDTKNALNVYSLFDSFT